MLWILSSKDMAVILEGLRLEQKNNERAKYDQLIKKKENVGML